MKKTSIHDETREMLNLCRTDPQRYLNIINQRIAANPLDSNNYFDRHYAWMQMNQPRKALEDLDKAIELQPDQTGFRVRGRVHRHLGEFERAIADFDRGEALHPDQWKNDAIGLLYQADCHARLGNEANALACCARLPEDFCTPGLRGAPAGNKAEIANELRRIAAVSRKGQR